MWIASPHPAVRVALAGVLRDGGYHAESVCDVSALCAQVFGTGRGASRPPRPELVVIDARAWGGEDTRASDAGALRRIAEATPALIVIAEPERRVWVEETVAGCSRSLVLERLDLVSVLVCAEMLVGGRLPRTLRAGAGSEPDALPAAADPGPPA